MSDEKQQPSIALFVEDPGAVTFIRPMLEDWEKNTWNVGLFTEGAASSLLADVDPRLKPSCLVGTERDWLSLSRPDVMVVGTAENVDSTAFDWIAAANELGIPTIGFVDTSANAEYRFRGRTDDPLFHRPGQIVVTDEKSRDNFCLLGMESSNVHVCGHPNFDRVRQLATNLNPRPSGSSKVRCIFLAELSTAIGDQTFQRDEEYQLFGSGQFVQRTMIVLEEFLFAIGPYRESIELVLRLHPKNRLEEFDTFEPSFDEIQQGGNATEAIQSADCVVGMTTALIDEAALLGIPTLSITPRAKEVEWCHSVGWGATVAVHTREALQKQIQHTLEYGEFLRDTVASLPPLGAIENVNNAILDVVNRYRKTPMKKEALAKD